MKLLALLQINFDFVLDLQKLIPNFFLQTSHTSPNKL